MENNVGIFIDAENIRYVDLPYIMMEAKKYGRIIVSRLYADWTEMCMDKWKNHIVNYGIEPVHCPKLPKKNSVDIKLIDDIYDILYFKQSVHTYIIVSNDVDYLTPSRKIKLFGKLLVTFGYSNCSEVLKNVADKFVNISLLIMDDEETAELISKDHIELENVFETDNEDETDSLIDDEETSVKTTGDQFIDTVFEIMNGERHFIYKEMKNKLRKRLGLSSDQVDKKIIQFSGFFRVANVHNTSREKIYDITSINSDVHLTIDDQFRAIFQMSDSNELIVSQFREKLSLLINNFDQRIWGFTRFKDMVKTMFVGKYDIVDLGNSQYIKNLLF